MPRPYRLCGAETISIAGVLLAVLIAGFTGCAPLVANLHTRGRAMAVLPGSQSVQVRWQEQDDALAGQMEPVLTQAMEALKPYGDFTHPVTVYLYPDHQRLALATGQLCKPWMVGFGQYARIHLQSPATWAGKDWRQRFSRLVTHELAHVLMYQRCCNSWDWFVRDIPFWFREGFASAVAGQGRERQGRGEVRDYYLGGAQAGDPLVTGEKVRRTRVSLAYGASHRVFEDFLAVCGPRGVRDIVEAMGEGADFDQAFGRVVGFSPREFTDIWRSDLADDLPFASRWRRVFCPGAGQ